MNIQAEERLESAQRVEADALSSPEQKAAAWCELAALAKGNPYGAAAKKACSTWRDFARSLGQRSVQLATDYEKLARYLLLERKSNEQKLSAVEAFLGTYSPSMEWHEMVRAAADAKDRLTRDERAVLPPLMPMIRIPGGEFVTGAYSQKFKRSLPTFEIDKHEVTKRQFQACIAAGRCSAPRCDWDPEAKGEFPVTCISYADAARYCEWLGKRLPSGEEWEKAARGIDGRDYPWGSASPNCNLANGDECHHGAAPVMSYPRDRSPYGAMDMGANVTEWTTQCCTDIRGECWQRCTRGGHYRSRQTVDFMTHHKDVYLYRYERDRVYDEIGFRCVRTTD